MYRIRFHGRGGQGMKTASRMLGTAFFLEGFEVQDAPRYGAERRGAPIFAYVRADRVPVNERGVIQQPDLVIVADESLISIPAAGVLAGLGRKTVLLISSTEEADTWKQRLHLECPVLTLPAPSEIEDRLELRYVGAACAGAAARLTGVVSAASLEQAIRDELEGMDEEIIRKNINKALQGFELMSDNEGLVSEGRVISAEDYTDPGWIDLPFEEARISAPDIHAALTSEAVETGLWRTMRPVVNRELCNRCWWNCGSACPDGAISIDEEGYPQIDYDHCKGCLVCAVTCPRQAIDIISEARARQAEMEDEQK